MAGNQSQASQSTLQFNLKLGEKKLIMGSYEYCYKIEPKKTRLGLELGSQTPISATITVIQLAYEYSEGKTLSQV